MDLTVVIRAVGFAVVWRVVDLVVVCLANVL